jgi:hypothetical protein
VKEHTGTTVSSGQHTGHTTEQDATSTAHLSGALQLHMLCQRPQQLLHRFHLCCPAFQLLLPCCKLRRLLYHRLLPAATKQQQQCEVCLDGGLMSVCVQSGD